MNNNQKRNSLRNQPSCIALSSRWVVGKSPPTAVHHAGSKESSNRSGMKSKGEPGSFSTAARISSVLSFSWSYLFKLNIPCERMNTYRRYGTAHFNIANRRSAVPNASNCVSRMIYSTLQAFFVQWTRRKIRSCNQIKHRSGACSTRKSND